MNLPRFTFKHGP